MQSAVVPGQAGLLTRASAVRGSEWPLDGQLLEIWVGGCIASGFSRV